VERWLSFLNALFTNAAAPSRSDTRRHASEDISCRRWVLGLSSDTVDFCLFGGCPRTSPPAAGAATW